MPRNIHDKESFSKPKLEDKIKLIISSHLIQDYDFGAFITITFVKLSNDFHHAYIYWTTLSSNTEDVSEKLIKHEGAFRTHLAKAITMKRVPFVHMVQDALPDQVQNYEEHFTELNERDQQLHKLQETAKPVNGEDPYQEKPVIEHNFD